jgi:hypothetical protein
MLVAAGLAWYIEVRLTDVLLVNAAARAADQVAHLGLTGSLTPDDFAAVHTPERLASIASRLDPLLPRMREDGSGILRVQLFARDGTLLYSDLLDKRGEQIDIDDEVHLARLWKGTS